MRVAFGPYWAVVSLPVVYLAQQGLVLATCLPLRHVYLPPKDFVDVGVYDAVAGAAMLVGLALQRAADDRLYRFSKTRNPGRAEIFSVFLP